MLTVTLTESAFSQALEEKKEKTKDKNRTDQRASLGDSTLETLVVVKNMSEPHKLSDGTLRRIKGAYYRSLQK